MIHSPRGGRSRRLIPVAVIALFLSSAVPAAPDDPVSSGGRPEIGNDNTVEKGTRLDRAVVKDFAKTVLEAADILEEDHVKKVSRQELVEWGVRGLYRRLDEPLPLGVALRLEKVRRLKDEDLEKLLADARAHLGKRKCLEECRDIDLALAGIFSKLEPGYEHAPQKELRERVWGICGHCAHIGIETSKDVPRGLLRVVTPIVLRQF